MKLLFFKINCAQLNDKIFETLQIKHAVASAYHPQTNGQVTDF